MVTSYVIQPGQILLFEFVVSPPAHKDSDQIRCDLPKLGSEVRNELRKQEGDNCRRDDKDQFLLLVPKNGQHFLEGHWLTDRCVSKDVGQTAYCFPKVSHCNYGRARLGGEYSG